MNWAQAASLRQRGGAIMEGLIDKGMDRDKAKTLATAMALKLRDEAIAHAKKYGYINNNCS